MEAATIAAIEAAGLERIDAKGERKSALTREIIRLVMDDAKGTTRTRKGGKSGTKQVQTAEQRAAVRLERYRKDNWQDGFWTGPASDGQRRRLADDYGVTLPKGALAWQAGEALAEAKAKISGLPFISLVKKAA